MNGDLPPDEPKDHLGRIGQEVRDTFMRNRRVMSFGEFFSLFESHPEQYSRNAAQYLKDVFDHFGTVEVKSLRAPHPGGSITRFRLFDVPFDEGRDRLVGQEEVQNRVYRAISNFVREGGINKLILLHGPNGSAKSTFVSCLMRALEHYSTLDEGALYRFNWIFPSQKLQKGGLGFGGSYDGLRADGAAGGSYAYLDDDLIDAKLVDELHDNPIFLIPQKRRLEILDEKLKGTSFVVSDYLRSGDLGHKNKQIFESLLT